MAAVVGGYRYRCTHFTALAALPPAEATALLSSALHLRFCGELGHLRRLLALVEARASHRRAHADLLRGVHAHYLDKRLGFVGDVARAHLSRLVEDAAAFAAAAAAVQHGPDAGGAAAAPTTTTTGGGGGGMMMHGLIDPPSYRREAHLLEGVRSACALMACTASTEHSLFHALFVAQPSAAAAVAAASADGSGWQTSRNTTGGGWET